MEILIQGTDAGFNLQLTNFAGKIGSPTYVALFNLTPAQVAAITADALAFAYGLNSMIAIQTFAHNYTEYKTELLSGTEAIGAFPIMPVLGAAPAAVPAGIKTRFRAFIQTLVNTPGKVFTTAVGQDLGVIAPTSNFDPTVGKPALTVKAGAGGHPKLHYIKGDFEGVEIWKDSGTGFIKLERITQANYIDPSPLPAANVSAAWRYKAIFIYKDAQTADWSDVVNITVNGAV